MIQRDADTIEVRAEERIDTTRLEPYLREHLDGADGPLTVRQFGGGHANLTYLIRFGEREWVLRRPPLAHVLPTAHDMAREHRVISALDISRRTAGVWGHAAGSSSRTTCPATRSIT